MTNSYATESSNIVLVINSSELTNSLTKQQVRNIYMGGALSQKYLPVHLPVGDPLRVDFNTYIIGLTESRIQSYWAQMKFTGRSKPPIVKATVDEVLQYIIEHENAIAYIPENITLPISLAVLSLSKG